MGMGGMGMQGMGMQGGIQFMNPALGFVAQGAEAMSTFQGLGGSDIGQGSTYFKYVLPT
jgi:hypothetical protein